MLTEWTSYLPKHGNFDAVLATRREACAVRAAIGLSPGNVWSGACEHGPMVYWSCAFADANAHAKDLAARADSAEFESVRARMSALIERFERCMLSNVGHASGVVRDTPIGGLAVVPREVEFQSGDLLLKGYLFVPPGDGPFPCMLMNHGSTIDRGTEDVCRPGSAAWLMALGIAAFLPHRRGYGNSPGVPWHEEVSAEFGSANYDEQLALRLRVESDDVLAALECCATLPEIDHDHIGVIGSSFGGTVTLLASARTGRLRCAVEFAGAAMNWERTPRLRESMLDAAAKGACPIYFIQAANDYSVAPTLELAASLADGSRVVRSTVFPQFGLTRDEGHLFHANGAAIWGDEVRGFLERWL